MSRLALLLIAILAIIAYSELVEAVNPHGADIEDNDFAEFEDFEDDDDMVEKPKFIKEPTEDQDEQAEAPPPKKVLMAPEAAESEADNADDEDATVEEDEDEFEHLQDDEEFEGFDKDRPIKTKGQEKQPDLKIAKVPLHLRTNWDSFYMEMLMLAGLGIYFLNFLAGKTKNNKLAQAWLSSHKSLLMENFAIVGDDGKTKDIEDNLTKDAQSDDGTSTEVQQGVMMKESESVYSLWCTGRMCCEGMLVTLKLLKRQDLVSTISRMFRPQADQVIVKVTMDAAEMDMFVFCLANKKILAKLHKDMMDLACFCPEKKKVDTTRLPASFQLLSEIPEATTAILDSKVVSALNKYEDLIEYMHISDQYSGPRNQDDSQTSKVPEVKKVLIFAFNVPGKGRCTPQDMAAMKPLMQMVFHCVDKVRKIRLSREAKIKAERNRQKMQESYSKASHQQRCDAAQARKEAKRRDEKEKMMNEDDPDKQRKLEEKSNKKDAKRRQPKVKMMKVGS